MSGSNPLSNGEQVEVLKRHRDSTTPTYHRATVVSSSSNHRVTVEYYRSRKRQVVDRADVRPIPPREPNEYFKVNDNVDVCSGDRWRVGTVRGIREDSRYVVRLKDAEEGGEEAVVVVDHFNLRLHRKWLRGSWVPPLPQRMPESEGEVGPAPRSVRLKIKCCKRKSEPLFEEGTMVEVRSDDEGYQGAWYGAMIVGSIGLGNDKFLVQYLNLLTEDESAPLQEVAFAHNIRPFPPGLPHFGFRLCDKVDAWFNEGWWEGVISQVISGCSYMVYFSSTRENLRFQYYSLRPHQDWIDGKWVKGKSTESEVCQGSPWVKFRKGTKVEVKSDEAGFQGAWFTATIVEVMANEKFLVEYHSLLTDDKMHLLREEAHVSDIRPSPPYVQRVYPFQVLEMVDAWYNDGWWMGRITKVKEGWRYVVKFRTMEELEFEHSKLRPHQEWCNGNWINVA